MRAFVLIAVLTALPAFAQKLVFEDRVELTRGLMAEYGAVKVLLPHSKKALEFDSNGTFDKKEWAAIAKESGPAARVGDTVQITKVEIGHDRIELEINGGYKGGRHWYSGMQVSTNGAAPRPVGNDNDTNAPGGTSIVILFHKPLEPIKAAEIKKMLAPVLDFEKHSVTEIYSESLPPEVQKAIKDKHVVEGMNREQVVMAMGKPVHKSREVKDGLELEDWVYGQAPGKITFITFKGEKVMKVKEAYAGLGSQVQDPH
jgi:hypothetical protein